MALVFCLLGTTVPLTALAAGEDGEVQYIVSNDGTTLTIQGDGEITSQALDANVTAEQKKTLTSVEIGAGVTGIADGYSSVFPAGVTNVTLKGSGAFRFGKYSFKGQKNLTVQSERTSLAIGSYAFHNAVLTEFPMDQLHTIGSYGFSNAVLPLEGETLTLRIEDQVDVEAQYPAISVGSCAFSGVKNKEGTAFITEIEERKNYIIRRASNLSKQAHIIATNLDQAMLIVTVNYPITTTIFIDRFLATAEAYRVPVKLVFNKIDRYNNEDQRALENLIELYTSIGYPCSTLCARTEEGLDALKADLKDKITLLSGHSGVGKSTIINKLVPGVNLRTGDISEYHNKGMHTTTFSEMIPLPGGGYLIDTPGIKGFGTIEMADAEISHYFRELFKYSEECRFNNCTHRHEPGCAVIQAVNDGLISESRYKSYLSILDDRMESKYREEF